MAVAAILNFIKSGIFCNSDPHMANIYSKYLCTKFDANIFIGDRDMAQKSKSKMAAAAVLDFNKSVILGLNDPSMQTKFDANRSRIAELQKSHWQTCLCISKMAATRHLGFVLPQFWTSHDVTLGGLNLPANGIMIRSDATGIMRFLRLRGCGWKCLFGAIVGSFGDFDALIV